MLAWRFEQHMAWLLERFEVVTIDKLLFLAGSRGACDKPLALISFDDGYIDSYAVAFPILKKAGSDRALFLPTLFIGTNRVPWWDEMAWILRHARHKEIHPFGTSESFLLDDENIEHSIRDILRLAKMRHLPLCQQTDDLAEVCGVARPDSPNGPLFLDWNQVRELRLAGMDIGSHTHSHPLLAHLCLKLKSKSWPSPKRSWNPSCAARS